MVTSLLFSTVAHECGFARSSIYYIIKFYGENLCTGRMQLETRGFRMQLEDFSLWLEFSLSRFSRLIEIKGAFL